jgi:hypothetical protein
MNSISHHFLSKVLALIAGLAFLNMSFFLAEVSLLNLDEKGLIENVAMLILNTGLEEEREGGSSGEKSVKEIVLNQAGVHRISSYLISITSNCFLVDHYRHANHSLRFSPPPDFREFAS